MLLDRIDIDTHGPLTRVELGPFSEHLNVVCTPVGSGKTAIARFIRDSLIRREYPLGMMSSSAGRVVWADRNGKIHCRREQDGSPTGRRTIEFESRGDSAIRFDWLHGSWIDGIADSTDATRALESIRIPESIVDGIVTDTAVTSVSRVIQACLSSGLGDPSLFAQLPLGRSNVSGLSPASTDNDDARRRSIRDELARVEAELATFGMHHVNDRAADPSPRSTATEARRYQLQERLAVLQSRRGFGDGVPGRPLDGSNVAMQLNTQWSQLHDRIWQLRVRHSELSRWLANLQSDRNRIRYTAPITASPYAESSAVNHAAGLIPSSPSTLELDAEMRRQLMQVDGQIIRWRRVLAELTSLRQLVTQAPQYRTPEPLFRFADHLPLSEHSLRHERMNHFRASLDHYVTHPAMQAPGEWFASEAFSSRWPDEIDLRIESIVRQIDWLARQYDRPRSETISWYRDLPRGAAYRGNRSLIDSLRAIREDLQNVRRQGFRFATPTTRRDQELDEVRRSEQWAVATIEQLLAYRHGLVRDRDLAARVRYPSWLDESYHRQRWSSWYIDHLDREADARSRELADVNSELDRSLARAAELHRQTRSPSFVDPIATREEINTILSELQWLDRSTEGTSVDTPRVVWLKNRRDALIKQLGVPQVADQPSGTPLADEASQWLVRLSGGRLRRVDWNPSDFTTAPTQVAAAKQFGFATIDGREEAGCPGVDRALAALAVRLAAGDLLARTGRDVPLVVEAHREVLFDLPPTRYSADGFAAASQDGSGPLNLAVVAALEDYSKNGRQVIVLASEPLLADQIARRGGQVFSIHGERLAHEHRPLWQPHYAAEAYAGPHAGAHLPPREKDPMPHSDAFVDRYHDQYFDSLPIGASLADVNRNLDTIWQEAYGISPYSVGPPTGPPTSPLPQPNRSFDGVPVQGMTGGNSESAVTGTWHDGYYFADNYTTAKPSAPPPHSPGGPTTLGADSPTDAVSDRHPPRRQSSPFFLTVDSPIDQAPSVDAVAASRLRRLNVTHVNHLMNQDPNRLADSLGLAGVTAASIRRWQSECRLVCHVPQLRGFDARVLVGCGITDPGRLSSTDPIDLLDRVEAFLATERGQRILLSGTSYELSRITSWIASANVSTDDDSSTKQRDHRTVDGRVVQPVIKRQAFDRNLDNDQYEYEFIDDNGDVVRATSNRSRLRREKTARRSTARRNPVVSTGNVPFGRRTARTEAGSHSAEQDESDRGRSSRSSRLKARRSSRRAATDRGGVDRVNASGSGVYRSDRGQSDAARQPSHQPSRRQDSAAQQSAAFEHGEGEQERRFYLQRESPIVDAPSIGTRMAERLEAVGIDTVNDLLQADAADLAEQLDHRRIDADVILSWQNQSILVCRVPMLRGHDAQLLVAADVTTPEAIAEFDAEELFALIDPIARSNEGKRILRGGNLPDREEISEWIHYAGLHRELIAA